MTPARPLAAYTPEDAQVRAMVSKGIYFLERSKHDRMDSMFEGGYILVGYAVFKVLADKDHPLVKKGIAVATTSSLPCLSPYQSLSCQERSTTYAG